MKPIYLFALVFLFTSSIYSQIKYEKGYIINNSGNRVEIYFRNTESAGVPTQINYRLSKDGETLTATPGNIRELGSENELKVISREVDIDQSSQMKKDLDKNKDPFYHKKRVFLRTLVEGKANLYETTYSGRKLFFYSIDDSELHPLVYKKYINKNNNIAENQKYRKQLYDNLACGDNRSNVLRKTDYSTKYLAKYISAYNNCVESEQISYIKKGKTKFNLNIRPGINFSKFELDYGDGASRRAFSHMSKLGFRIGLEGEIILPFNRNKWSVFAEPNYQTFNYKEPVFDLEVEVNFSSLELALGARHYLFISDDAKFFVNVAIVPQITFDSNVLFYGSNNKDLEIQDKMYYAGGVGFKYLNKFSAEVRYNSSRNILGTDAKAWKSNYGAISLIVGYSIF